MMVRLSALALVATASIAIAQTPTPAQSGDTTKAQPLPQVVISGRTVSVPPRFEAAYKRAASGRGYYFTREEIQATNPRDLETLMQRVPAVSITERQITFQKCQGGLASAVADAGPPEAKVQVYIDGRRTNASTGESALEVLQGMSPSEVQLMEVYNGASRIPGEFSTDACAVILIWTRAY